MKKTIITIGLISVLLLSGCSKPQDNKTDDPDAPHIQYTEGQFYDTNPPIMEGAVTEIDADTITLKIKGQEYSLSLSDRAKEEIEIFSEKYDKHIKVGTFLQIKYEEKDGNYIANNIMFLKGNLQVEEN